jgi:hypothetical protein
VDYLKDIQHYNDRYDLFTIKACLRVISFWQKSYKESSKDKELKKLSKEEKERGFNYYLNQELYGTQGEDYRRKKETIQKWIEADRLKQNKYDSTSEPQNIHCPACGTLMHSTIKELEDFMDKPIRVFFFFECPSCKKRKGVYENGEEHVSKPDLCPKCTTEVKTTHTKKGNVITWTTKCPSCGFTEAEVDDFDKKRAQWKKEEEEDKKLLEKYRTEFCLTDEKGKEYIELIEKLQVAKEVQEEEKRKYDNPTFQKAALSKKIGIVELERLLAEALEKEKYIKLYFDKPELNKDVIVPFTAQDADPDRKEFDRINSLKKLINNILEGTNWRLMTDCITHRLGFVSGRLKGYEREEELVAAIGNREEQPPKIDQGLRAKWAHDPLVSLARMMGQSEAKENLRKKRLEKEPEGFHLEESEGSYSCLICQNSISGKDTWWDINGLKCIDCQRNIREKVIPAEICKDNKLYLKDWQIQNDYSLHAATVGKLRRQGVLRARELKKQDGSIYLNVYLVKENKEFFKKYPKKEKMKVEFINTGGKKIQL